MRWHQEHSFSISCTWTIAVRVLASGAPAVSRLSVSVLSIVVRQVSMACIPTVEHVRARGPENITRHMVKKSMKEVKYGVKIILNATGNILRLTGKRILKSIGNMPEPTAKAILNVIAPL